MKNTASVKIKNFNLLVYQKNTEKNLRINNNVRDQNIL